MSLTEKSLEIPCPGCKTKIQTSLEALEHNNEITCPSCKAVTTVNGAKAPAAALRGVEKALRGLGAKRIR